MRPKYDGREKEYICNICSEPWDSYGVKNGDMTHGEADDFFAGKGCPCCRGKKEGY